MKVLMRTSKTLRIFVLLSVAAMLGAAAPRPSRVHVKTLKNGHFQLMVEKKPYIIQGVCYNPIPIGSTHDFDFWSDPRKPWIVDGELMKKMGINTVRFYGPGEDLEAVRRVVSDLYQKYGIRTIMGHWLGFWNYPAPLYDDKAFRDKVKEDVLAMVKALKDEPGILFWVLGNENNYSFSGKINPWSSDRIDKLGDPRRCMEARAEAYYSLVDELAVEIKKIDPSHPVAMGNGELICLDQAKDFTKNIDILGIIIYRGKTFGNIFSGIRQVYNKPFVFIEFGSDAYDAFRKQEDQDVQALFLENQWREIFKNLANVRGGVGNCLGGAFFEWHDEWWKHSDWDMNSWSVQDTVSNWSNGAYYFDIQADGNMNMNEEWFGIVKLKPASDGGLDERVPRKAYYVIREFWKNPRKPAAAQSKPDQKSQDNKVKGRAYEETFKYL